MMRRVALVVVGVAVFLAQMSFLPALRPFGVVPDVALVLVVLVGLEGTASAALVLAVAGGLVLDLASGVNFGLWTAVLVLAALVAGLVQRAGIEPGGGAVAVAMVAAGTVVMAAVIWLGMANTVAHWPVGWMLTRLGLELVLNLMVTLALRPTVRWMVGGLSAS
jgi:hypothetical protein